MSAKALWVYLKLPPTQSLLTKNETDTTTSGAFWIVLQLSQSVREILYLYERIMLLPPSFLFA